MSLLNMGLQSVGFMRSEMSDEEEAPIFACNSLNQLRQVASKHPSIRESCLDSIEPVKVLLHNTLGRIQLKGKNTEAYLSAKDEEISKFEEVLLAIDETIEEGEKLTKASLKSHPKLTNFYEHCCQLRHYSFCVKKCGTSDCTIRTSPRLPSEIFEKLAFYPILYPKKTVTTNPLTPFMVSEEHYPSLQKRPTRRKTLPFVASVQHARNTNLMVQCEECEMWRLVYSKCKLNKSELSMLQGMLDDFTYTCGASLSDLGLARRLEDVVICTGLTMLRPPRKAILFVESQANLYMFNF